MKIFFTAVITACLLLSCNNKPANNDTINLKFNLQPGMSYDYSMDMTMAMKGNVSGQH